MSSTNTGFRVAGNLSLSGFFRRDTAARLDTIVSCGGASGNTQSDNIQYCLRIGTDNKVEYVHENGGGGTQTSIKSTNTLSTDTGSNTGYFKFTLRRDTTAKTVTVKVNDITVINAATYTNNPDGGTTANFEVLRCVALSTQTMDGAIYKLRVWSSLIAQATLDTLPFGAEGTELAFYQFATGGEEDGEGEATKVANINAGGKVGSATLTKTDTVFDISVAATDTYIATTGSGVNVTDSKFLVAPTKSVVKKTKATITAETNGLGPVSMQLSKDNQQFYQAVSGTDFDFDAVGDVSRSREGTELICLFMDSEDNNAPASGYSQDTSMNGYHCTKSASLATRSPPAGKENFGEGYDFTATTSGLSCGGPFRPIERGTELSIFVAFELDVLPSTLGADVAICSIEDAISNPQFRIAIRNSDNKLTINFGNSVLTASTNAMTTGFHAITVRESGGTLVVKVDGATEINTSYDFTGLSNHTTIDTLYIGGDGFQRSFDGGMYEFRLWAHSIPQDTLDKIADGTKLSFYDTSRTLVSGILSRRMTFLQPSEDQEVVVETGAAGVNLAFGSAFAVPQTEVGGASGVKYMAAYVQTSATINQINTEVSTDSGATWGGKVQVATETSNCSKPRLIWMTGTTYIVTYLTGTTLKSSKSTDAGSTWGAAVTIQTSVLSSGTYQVAKFSASKLALAYFNSTDDLHYIHTTDTGATWTGDVSVDTEGTTINLDCAIATDGGSKVMILYETDVSGTNTYKIKSVLSSNGGSTFGTPTVIRTTTSATGNLYDGFSLHFANKLAATSTWVGMYASATVATYTLKTTNDGTSWTETDNTSVLGNASSAAYVILLPFGRNADVLGAFGLITSTTLGSYVSYDYGVTWTARKTFTLSSAFSGPDSQHSFQWLGGMNFGVVLPQSGTNSVQYWAGSLSNAGDVSATAQTCKQYIKYYITRNNRNYFLVTPGTLFIFNPDNETDSLDDWTDTSASVDATLSTLKTHIELYTF